MTSDGLRHQVCTLEGTEKKWVGTQLKTVGVLGHAVAVGHCLAARLGYDRSGYARAVVPRKGMPHYPTRDVLRGTGTIEEREQLLGQKSAAAPAPELDPATCERGDLIVKVPVKLPRDRTRPQRLCLVEGVLHLPPVVLLTSALNQVIASDDLLMTSDCLRPQRAPDLSAGHRCAAPWRAPRAGRTARRAVHAHAAPGPSHSHCDPPPTSRRSRQRAVDAGRVQRLWWWSLLWCIRFMWCRRCLCGRRGGHWSGCRGR